MENGKEKKKSIYFYLLPFFDIAKQDNLSPTAQALYIQIVGIINASFWKMPLRIKEQDLLDRINAKHDSFIKARKELVTKGLILYISTRPLPPNYILADISGKLAQEKDQADNQRKHEENEKELDNLIKKNGWKRKQGNAPA